jgi:hypothetical protein
VIPRFALIIGAQKAGTTSLFHYLAEHPQIAACSIKEPFFFSKDEIWARGLDWYNGLWDWNPEIHRYAVEGSTDYSYSGKAPATVDRIRSVDAEFRFLFVVRNPFDRIESHFGHAYRAGWDGRHMTIDEAIDRRSWLLERSMYARQLDPYRERFGRDRIHVIDFARLVSSPAGVLRKIAEFLDIDPPPETGGSARVYNPGRGRKMEHPLFVRIRKNRFALRTLRSAVPDRLQTWLRGRMSGGPAPTFRLSPDSRRRIGEALREEIDRLRDDYGVDTSSWLP